jgi:two-component system LytT family sensor kinase
MASPTVRRYLTPLIHVLMWGLFGLAFVLFQPMLGRVALPTQFWVKQGAMLGFWVGAFYLTSLVSVPRLLLQSRTGWFIIALLATAIVVMLANGWLESVLQLPERMDQAFRAADPVGHSRPRPPKGLLHLDMRSLLTTLLVLGISTSITVVQQWQADARSRQQLEQQQVSAELAALKAQINPHFFFNTLNNIYSLTLLDGDKARTALHQLSRMMRYVLYDTAAGQTRLSQEIDFIQDYLSLMQLRLTDRVTLVFERPQPPTPDVPIAPMLLLPFVENAFKHGVAATAPSRIVIALRQPSPQTLVLEVSNTRVPVPGPDLAGSSGIGLANTRRRLDLLYPGRYTLELHDVPPADYHIHLSLTVA